MFWRKRPVEIEVMIIRPREPLGKRLIMVLFFLWGVGGFIVCAQGVISAISAREVGVGTSAFLLVMIMFWIGGMLLLGLGALMAYTPLAVSKYDPNQ